MAIKLLDRWMNMSEKIKKIIHFTKQKFGLDDYYLKDDNLHRHVNIFNEMVYILSMEWFPNQIKEREEDGSNPEGVAVIDIEIDSKKVQSAIFVGGKSFENGISFYNHDMNEIIKWVEQETQLIYGTHFQKYKKTEREYRFIGCIEEVPVSPAASVEIKLDQEGKLTFFAMYGQFPSEKMIQKETYTLSFEKIEDFTKKQLKLIELPSFEEEKLLPIYALEEIYLTNDQQTTIPFEFIVDKRAYIKVDKVIEWETRIHQPFEGQEIELT